MFIDTATEKATIALTIDQKVVGLKVNEVANTHAVFVQVAIEEMIKAANFNLADLDAITVTLGPGSYTGLRVGLSSAKGIAYALNKPLIGLSTLQLLSKHASRNLPVDIANNPYSKVFTAIDARRMEVFGAFFSNKEEALSKEEAFVLDQAFFEQHIQDGPLVCIGSANTKIKEAFTNMPLYFIDSHYTVKEMMEMALTKFEKKQFEDLAYSAPTYIKEVYTIPPKKSL